VQVQVELASRLQFLQTLFFMVAVAVAVEVLGMRDQLAGELADLVLVEQVQPGQVPLLLKQQQEQQEQEVVAVAELELVAQTQALAVTVVRVL
jgi:hypothetical protein